MDEQNQKHHWGVIVLVVVVVILGLVFIGQKYLGEPEEEAPLKKDLSQEEREAISRSLSADAPPPLTSEEKMKVLESLSKSEPATKLTPEEQENILKSLNDN